MILSDRSIRDEIRVGGLGIEPFDPDALQPCSVDVTLSSQIRLLPWRSDPVDVKGDISGLTEEHSIGEEGYLLCPNELILGSTVESFRLPSHLVGRIEGKSSLGRLGLMVHSTAGFIDAGFRGQLTLELSSITSSLIVLYPGMKIAQVSFMRMTTAAERPYGTTGLNSKYLGQEGPQPSRYQMDPTPDEMRPLLDGCPLCWQEEMRALLDDAYPNGCPSHTEPEDGCPHCRWAAMR